MHAEIICTGSELLLGEIVDTNSGTIIRQLKEIGLETAFITCVGDDLERMTQILNAARQRSQVIIVTGGLGPTVDDITRDAVSLAVGRPLRFHQELLDQITARMARFNRGISSNNRRQAFIPEGGLVIENHAGTAPAFILEEDNDLIICLPGVPRELEYLLPHSVIPYLKKKIGDSQIILSRTLRTCGIGESVLDSIIADLETSSNPIIGLAAHTGQVDIRLTAKAKTADEAMAVISPVEEEIRRRLGVHIYGTDKELLSEVVGNLLKETHCRLNLADSVTHGKLAYELQSLPVPDLVSSAIEFDSFASFLVSYRVTEEAFLQDSLKMTQEYASSLVTDESMGLCVLGPFLNESENRQTCFLGLASQQKATAKVIFITADYRLEHYMSMNAMDFLRRQLLNADN